MKTRTLRILRNILSSIIVTLTIIIGFFSIGGLVFNAVYIAAPVSSFSMRPTINSTAPDASTEWDYAYLNRYASYTNNDIVIAKVSWYNKHIIKRLVASPGDTLEIRNEETQYALYVNEQLIYTKPFENVNSYTQYKLDEYYKNYLDLLNRTDMETSTTSNGEKYLKLKNNQYMLMGDNWAESFDCITNGPVEKSKILGKVDFIISGNQSKFWSIAKQIVVTTFKL